MVCNDLWSIKLMVLLEMNFQFQLEKRKEKDTVRGKISLT